ncbi:hypothetical protein EHR03_13135 [Leptospira mayottensis]|uniref:Uncharacterized protein n=2 Tax=Leptospira mayottensis TaxID=1137606 RepID=A0A343URZ0_9LEPT|nr:hypothetical protein [Leptospira mayottensis]AVH81563.1 hypothetical protein [Leptospira mayottensis 200901116]TGN00364.1 hypothetical protein EHR03_13135 [Leptospira mayottensis]
MKTQIDKMQNPSGWTVQLQNTNEPYSLTGVDYEECRASYIPGQIQAELPAGAILGKDFNQIQVAETKWISFTIGLVSIQNPNMKFTVYSGENKRTFVFEVQQKYTTYRFINPFETIDRIEFSATGLVQFVVTDLIAYTNDYPADIYAAMIPLIQKATSHLPKQIVGTTTVMAGDKSIRFTEICLAERYSAIEFNGEIHHIKEKKTSGKNFELTFSDLFDGQEIRADALNIQVYLTIPVLPNPVSIESVRPGIGLHGGYEFEKVPERSFVSDEIICRDTDENYYIRRSEGILRFKPVIHGLYKNYENLGYLSKVLQQFEGNDHPIWVNGRRVVISFGQVTLIKFEEDDGELQLPCEIELGVYNEWETEIKTNLNYQINSIPAQNPN